MVWAFVKTNKSFSLGPGPPISKKVRGNEKDIIELSSAITNGPTSANVSQTASQTSAWYIRDAQTILATGCYDLQQDNNNRIAIQPWFIRSWHSLMWRTKASCRHLHFWSTGEPNRRPVRCFQWRASSSVNCSTKKQAYVWCSLNGTHLVTFQQLYFSIFIWVFIYGADSTIQLALLSVYYCRGFVFVYVEHYSHFR